MSDLNLGLNVRRTASTGVGADVDVGADGSRSQPRLEALGAFFATDNGLALACSLVLFVLSAWPLMLVQTPPYQDLPNHLAAAHILQHADRYPEFVGNGLFKTNAALFAWLLVGGRWIGLAAASRVFAAVTLAAGAWVYPRVLLAFGGRARLAMGSFFLYPMVHNWFVSKGMLDFALGVPLSLGLLVLIKRQLEATKLRRLLAIGLLSLCTWYAHGFSLIVALGLFAFHLAFEGRGQWREAVRGVIPALVPASALTAYSVYRHLTEPGGAMAGYVETQTLIVPWELLYNMWAEWCAGFTWLSLTSGLVILGGAWGLLRWRKVSPTFFSPWALLLLAGIYVVSPYTTTNWFHVNSRLIPYLWMGLLLRLPDTLPTMLKRLMVFGGLAYSLGMGVDYKRLDADREAFTAGIGHVSEGARLLPLVFESKATSETTRSLEHAWGFYVVERTTSAPLLFAHSRSFPLMYREPPPPRFNHLVLGRFAPTMGNEMFLCGLQRGAGVFTDDCPAEWTRRWDEFWRDATPRYDEVLLWAPPPHVIARMPASYSMTFHQDKLYVYRRNP
jgi:hypothetical protein